MSRDVAKERYFRRQLAARRLFLSADGKPNPDARILLATFKRFCFADRGQSLNVSGDNGIDAVGTVARAARREVWDKFTDLLNLDQYEITNIREDD